MSSLASPTHSSFCKPNVSDQHCKDSRHNLRRETPASRVRIARRRRAAASMVAIDKGDAAAGQIHSAASAFSSAPQASDGKLPDSGGAASAASTRASVAPAWRDAAEPSPLPHPRESEAQPASSPLAKQPVDGDGDGASAVDEAMQSFQEKALTAMRQKSLRDQKLLQAQHEYAFQQLRKQLEAQLDAANEARRAEQRRSEDLARRLSEACGVSTRAA